MIRAWPGTRRSHGRCGKKATATEIGRCRHGGNAARAGTTASGATCHGGCAGGASPTPIASGCPRSCCSRRPSRPSSPTTRASWRAGRRWRRWRPRPSTMSWPRGRGLATTAARAICTSAPRSWPASIARALSEAEAGLRELPGIGPYTAAAIAAIAFGARDNAGRRQHRARRGAAVCGEDPAAGGQARDRSGSPAP